MIFSSANLISQGRRSGNQIFGGRAFGTIRLHACMPRQGQQIKRERERERDSRDIYSELV